MGTNTHVIWGQVYGLINYFKLAVIQLPIYQFSKGEVIIIHAITKFILRILEQSLISEFKPLLNSVKMPVLFTYTSWDPILLSVYDYLMDGSRAVTILNAVTGEQIRPVVPSIAQAADLLQINRNIFNRYLQSVDVFYSVIFGCKVTLGLVGAELIKK